MIIDYQVDFSEQSSVWKWISEGSETSKDVFDNGAETWEQGVQPSWNGVDVGTILFFFFLKARWIDTFFLSI